MRSDWRQLGPPNASTGDSNSRPVAKPCRSIQMRCKRKPVRLLWALFAVWAAGIGIAMHLLYHTIEKQSAAKGQKWTGSVFETKTGHVSSPHPRPPPEAQALAEAASPPLPSAMPPLQPQRSPPAGAPEESSAVSGHKIAFLFLTTTTSVPTEDVWRAFFGPGLQNLGARASVLVHVAHDSGKGFPEGSLFHGRELPKAERVSAKWGSITLVEAQVRLASAALRDRANQAFVYLSESCVPIHSFDCMYEFFFATDSSPRGASTLSFASTWKTDERRDLYGFEDDLVRDQWRKGSQWVILWREDAELIARPERIAAWVKAHVNGMRANGGRVLRTFVAAFYRGSPRAPKTLDDPRLLRDIHTYHHAFADEHFVQVELALAARDQDYSDTFVPMSMTHFELDGWHPVTWDANKPGATEELRRIQTRCGFSTGTARSKAEPAERMYFAASRVPLLGTVAGEKDPQARETTQEGSCALSSISEAAEGGVVLEGPCYLFMRKVKTRESAAEFLRISNVGVT